MLIHSDTPQGTWWEWKHSHTDGDVDSGISHANRTEVNKQNPRLLNSPSLVAIGLSEGMRHGLQLAGITLLWLVDLNIDWDRLVSHCIMDSRDLWEFPPFFRFQLQSLCTTLTAGKCCARGLWKSLTRPRHGSLRLKHLASLEIFHSDIVFQKTRHLTHMANINYRFTRVAVTHSCYNFLFLPVRIEQFTLLNLPLFFCIYKGFKMSLDVLSADICETIIGDLYFFFDMSFRDYISANSSPLDKIATISQTIFSDAILSDTANGENFFKMTAFTFRVLFWKNTITMTS